MSGKQWKYIVIRLASEHMSSLAIEKKTLFSAHTVNAFLIGILQTASIHSFKTWKHPELQDNNSFCQ